MRRSVVAVSAVLLFLATGALILYPGAAAAAPVRFVLTLAVVFGMCVLSAAIALATAPRQGP